MSNKSVIKYTDFNNIFIFLINNLLENCTYHLFKESDEWKQYSNCCNSE